MSKGDRLLGYSVSGWSGLDQLQHIGLWLLGDLYPPPPPQLIIVWLFSGDITACSPQIMCRPQTREMTPPKSSTVKPCARWSFLQSMVESYLQERSALRGCCVSVVLLTHFPGSSGIGWGAPFPWQMASSYPALGMTV